jgi:hypothetical protein
MRSPLTKTRLEWYINDITAGKDFFSIYLFSPPTLVWLHIRQFNGNCLRVHFGEPQRLDEALAR